MSAIGDLYNLVKARLTTDQQSPAVGIIKHFDWWNDNIIQDGTQTPFPTPAVFFELNFMSWDPSTVGSSKNDSSLLPEQNGTGEIILHVVHKKTEGNAPDGAELNHLDEVDAVYRAIHFFGKGQSFLNGAIQRVRDETVLTHTVLRDWPIAFAVNLFECARPDETLEEVSPWEPEVTVEANEPYTDPGPSLSFNLKG